MNKKQVISCSSRSEMEKIAARMTGYGHIIKTVVKITPFHLYGLCVPEYKVIIQDESTDGKMEERLGFLQRFLRGTAWRSDLHKTSALSENSAL